MRKFLTSLQVKNLLTQQFSEDDIIDIFPNKNEISVSTTDLKRLFWIQKSKNVQGEDLILNTLQKPLSNIVPLPFSDFQFLEPLFSSLFPNHLLVRISKLVGLVKKIMLGNDILVSADHGFKGSSNQYVFARWIGDSCDLGQITLRPASISQILLVKFITRDVTTGCCSTIQLYIANVKWFKEHVYRNFFSRRNDSLSIWSTEYLHNGVSSYIPLQFICGHFTFAKKLVRFSKYHSDEVNIIIPLPSKSFF